MKRNLYASFLALLAALALAAAPAGAQQKARKGGNAQTPGANANAATAAVPLPASDAVLTVNLRRLLTEAVPRALGDDPARVAEVNADVEQFKARTGIDARAFDTLAVGARITNPSATVTKIDHVVAVARGTFDPAALVAAGRQAAKGNHTTQKHGGKDVHVFGLNDTVKLFGLLKLRVSDLALAVLDQQTLAVGEPEAVRAAIDAAAGRGRVDAELLKRATKPNDVIAFAGNVPPSAVSGLDLGLPAVNESVASIRGFHGSVGMTAAGFQMLTALRTSNARDAKNLFETLEAVKQVAPALLGVSGERGKLARKAIENLKLSAQGTEVQLLMELSQGDIAALRAVL